MTKDNEKKVTPAEKEERFEEWLNGLQERIRSDYEAGDLEYEDVWKMLAFHSHSLTERYAKFNPNVSALFAYVLSRKQEQSCDTLMEKHPEDQRLKNIKMAYDMLAIKIADVYQVDKIVDEDKETMEEVKRALREMHCWMQVSTYWQDICYRACVIKLICEQAVGDWAEWIEENGPNEGNLGALKAWKSLHACAEMANDQTAHPSQKLEELEEED